MAVADPLRAARSPQAFGTHAAWLPRPRYRDPLDLMRAPADTVDETRYSAEDNETSTRTHRGWSSGLSEGTQMECSIDQLSAPVDSDPLLCMGAHDELGQQSWQGLRQHSLIWQEQHPHSRAPHMPETLGVRARQVPGVLAGGQMSSEECRRYGVPLGSKWADSVVLKGSASPLNDSDVERIDWEQLPAVSHAGIHAEGRTSDALPRSHNFSQREQEPESCRHEALRHHNFALRWPSSSKASLDDAKTCNLSDALLDALKSDVNQCKAMYESFNELEAQLRQIYCNELPPFERLPNWSHTHRPIHSQSGIAENLNRSKISQKANRALCLRILHLQSWLVPSGGVHISLDFNYLLNFQQSWRPRPWTSPAEQVDDVRSETEWLKP